MKSSGAGKGGAVQAVLKWLLVLLVVANLAVWGARPFRDELVARGILAPPPVDRVDLAPRPLPPIIAPVDPPPVDETDALLADTTEAGTTHDTSTDEEAPLPVADADIAPLPPPVTTGNTAGASVSAQPLSSALLDCVITGPFENAAALAALETRLRPTDAVVELVVAPGAAPPETVVYIDTASRAEARLALQELRDRSIHDADILRSGPYANTVSVGVYGNRGRADARRDRIAALGFDVKLRERRRVDNRLRIRQVSIEALAGLSHEPCRDDEVQ